jgi:chromosomal replication initiator protein
MYGSEQTTVGLDEAKAVLKSRLDDRRRAATIDDAIAAGAEAFGLKLEDMTGRAQPQRIVRARHAVVWCAREVLKESFPRIGKAMKRDHTTVMSSYRRAQALMERDKAFQDGVRRVREALEG